MKRLFLTAICIMTVCVHAKTLVDENVVFEEKDGVVAAEAEHYFKQTKTDVRQWYFTTSKNTPSIEPDGDPNHADTASGGAYLESLPDTRRSHGDKLKAGQNFFNTPGQAGVLYYKVHINKPGRYYVWARIFSTNTEDNGMHVGIDGEWPESGQRMQWTKKKEWAWGSKQRTAKAHGGVKHKLYLDIEKPGLHTIMFSMREDGTEFDKWMMTTEKLGSVEGFGPEPRLKTGKLPPPAAIVALKIKKPKAALPPLHGKRRPDGTGKVTVGGELKRWHNVVLTLDGPFAHELDNKPNPFTDRQMNVIFTHESGNPKYMVPGYFAADGNAAETSAECGTKWRAHLSPDKTGKWTYRISFRGTAYDGISGSFTVGETDKSGRDLRGKGCLQYVDQRYLRFAGNGEYFLKAGADAPETFLAYADFDGTVANKPEKCPLKHWKPHSRDWKPGDPSWQGGKGKGMIGAINYLSGKGCNAFSFIPYNAGGDGDNVWPHVSRSDKLHFDCSKLDQWGIIFSHGTAKGMYLHFKLQETENDDLRGKGKGVEQSLDGGDLGPERKAYLRELIARFGHNLALNWNIGEENTQSEQQVRDMVTYIRQTDPYGHNVVLHTFPNQQSKVYGALLGDPNVLTGLSIQNSDVANSHRDALRWVTASEAAGHPWVVALDEAGNAATGMPPDPDFPGMAEAVAGLNKSNKKSKLPTIREIRGQVLWGTLMAGGAGVEYYFGYKLPENDLLCEDWRSRDRSWDYCRIALEFFRDQKIPFTEMKNTDALIGNPENTNGGYCFSKVGKIYLVYLPSASAGLRRDKKVGKAELDLSGAKESFKVQWFNPRTGGPLQTGSVKTVKGGRNVSLGLPPADTGQDWVVLVR